MPLPPIVVMGVSGCGKSTLAAALAASIDGGRYLDADDLHPASNIAKMSAGVPLTDVDRAPWLTSVGRALRDAVREGATPVMACSALKRDYRRRILAEEPQAWFLLLDVRRAELERRMRERHGHFMPASLLESQLATLQPLTRDEPGATLSVTGPQPQLLDRALAALTGAR